MKYGVICAMEEEIQSLLANLELNKKTNIQGIEFYDGVIGSTPVVLVRSGIGKVEAGITAALLVTNFKVDAVIHSGSAGGIGSGLKVGDVVLSSEVAYHDVDATAFGYEYGQLPQQPARFTADEKLIKSVKNAANENNLNVIEGLIVTGDQFIASKEATDKILKNFPDALCCEMEGAAIGQVAHQFKKPFLVIRAMSDTGDDEANVSFDDFIIEAGKRSAKMLLNFFEEG
ncbi:5'-methylthioadenosine/adenosylhomocysteine nucleosidase [Pediococcus claussenii]|uniref:5'-methylthioadenosine/S-adenosylhomocysteine nucleosidase n=1 Tax=Pediococcus claussenii (strain ATCC BAA-344 / DSM 14800 / JCM 18046 / KCTC 3811 / LMG 21948 / P06) TaxID=701521 RepID=G8PCV5_PEDCP|nr:5'-methylthioadenosine/adenosylhomocysteine nucleosidase [Pediococcus claussenii]AEV95090.1 MTA/SAH nucleosidase [Pediococcus claussenii ATCC BAA-344]ANZ70278.1 5'-methylthioadenosine nucleosidase [Pediococcus claussenii]ANZ72094.1 5'-methylthioadenosine nucleosidase [Pediococcus claussenii]KRN18951.1 mtnN protein [Pediococcus claussenii]